MNSIRFANKGDFLQIKTLWDLSFPGDKIFDTWFFEHVFSCDKTLVYSVENKVCSMMQVYPYELSIYGNLYPIYYVYGVCTLPDLRGKGLMSELLEYSFQLGKSEGKIASVLIPQNASLFALYEKFGYQKGFFANIIKVPSKEQRKEYAMETVQEHNLYVLNLLYEKTTSGYNSYIIRNKTYWLQQLNLFRATGGEIYLLKENREYLAYAFVGFNNNQLFIQEGGGKNEMFVKILGQYIAKLYKKTQVKIITTANFPNDMFPVGCIKFLTKDIPYFCGYMNLMFN